MVVLVYPGVLWVTGPLCVVWVTPHTVVTTDKDWFPTFQAEFASLQKQHSAEQLAIIQK